MNALISTDPDGLHAATTAFSTSFEPVLNAIEEGCRRGHRIGSIAEVQEYLQVCRWAFRRLEYSFVLEALQTRPGSLKCLELGCGATPLAHVLARLGHAVSACDRDERLIESLRESGVCGLLGTRVEYSVEDASRLRFPRETFDAVTCVSVLEHISPPADCEALREMLRVLRPGGLLLLTVDYAPALNGSARRLHHYVRRAVQVVGSEGMRGLRSAWTRKRRALRTARVSGDTPRSANQAFDWRHVEGELLAELDVHADPVPVGFVAMRDPRSIDEAAIRRFWDLEPGLFARQGRRFVVPLALAARKRSSMRQGQS